jgi:hypothetical protein
LVNYCENEAEYLKALSLFTAFMDRPDVKERLGECHSYVVDTYIAVTSMEKKEKLLFYNRLKTRNFDKCTSFPAEHENSSMKWGEMVVNPQQHMHQAVHTINKKSNSRFTVKEGNGAKNLDATQNWSTTKTNEFIYKYTEGMITLHWNKCSLYISIIISSRTWWVMLIIGDTDNSSEKGENDIHPRFRRVRVIQWVEGHNVLIYDCGYFHQIGLTCGHLFHVKGNICLTDCDIRWCKSYNYHFGRIPRYTQQVSQIINRVKVVGVPFVASPPTIVSPVYTNCTDSFFDWVTKAQSPVMMDESFPVRLDEDSKEEFYYNLANETSTVFGEYSSPFTLQQSRWWNSPHKMVLWRLLSRNHQQHMLFCIAQPQ